MNDNLDYERNRVVFVLLIVVTLMFLCTFLFTFFVLDNIGRVPCPTNRAVGKQGPQGIEGKAGKASTITGPPGLQPAGLGPQGEQGDVGKDITGDQGPANPANTGQGYAGGIGDTGDTGPAGFDGLVSPGVKFFPPPPQALVNFYEDTEVIAKASTNANFSHNVVDVKITLVRMGSIVTMNIYPFLIHRDFSTVPPDPTNPQLGYLQIPFFSAASGFPFPQYAPASVLLYPVISNKGNPNPGNQAAGNNQANVGVVNQDTPGMLKIDVISGVLVIYGNWTTRGEPKPSAFYREVAPLMRKVGALGFFRYWEVAVFALFGRPPPYDPTLPWFTDAQSPWGLQGIITATWLVPGT